ncbi:SgcJ/EcaC family oxidoreductase [Actinospongicola halichondriae]|uniref:SgcJ/EcaC family oxidoreductase n=1 Tax=Actinospongicola halichondriae TaxID=3236844 RepID=UPI003D506D9F
MLEQRLFGGVPAVQAADPDTRTGCDRRHRRTHAGLGEYGASGAQERLVVAFDFASSRLPMSLTHPDQGIAERSTPHYSQYRGADRSAILEGIDMNDTDQELVELVNLAQASQSDVEPFLALHTSETVIVNFGGRRVLGIRELRSAMEAALASPLADVTTSVEVHDIRYLRPDVALISCSKHVNDARSDGGDLASRGALSYVAVRDDRRWRIALAQTTPVATG